LWVRKRENIKRCLAESKKQTGHETGREGEGEGERERGIMDGWGQGKTLLLYTERISIQEEGSLCTTSVWDLA
jgi:hypothetical protein